MRVRGRRLKTREIKMRMINLEAELLFIREDYKEIPEFLSRKNIGSSKKLAWLFTWKMA